MGIVWSGCTLACYTSDRKKTSQVDDVRSQSGIINSPTTCVDLYVLAEMGCCALWEVWWYAFSLFVGDDQR